MADFCADDFFGVSGCTFILYSVMENSFALSGDCIADPCIVNYGMMRNLFQNATRPLPVKKRKPEVDCRACLVQAGKGKKTAMVLEAIARLRGDFAIADLQERCPTVGMDMVRRILRQELEAGRVECLGRGPKARWRRIG